MGRDFNAMMIERTKEVAQKMEERILTGEVIADVVYEVDKSRILVTRTSNGRYGYAVFEEGKDKPCYLAESDYLIKDLQKKTDYEGRPLLYLGAKSMIEKNMVGVIYEYRKYPNYHDFYVTVKASQDSSINVTQQMAGYNPQYPVAILIADFISNEFYYGALAQVYNEPNEVKPTIRIGVGTLNPDGTPNVEKSIKMERESQEARKFFGERALGEKAVEEIIKRHSFQAQALLTPMYEAVGLPMYEGVEYCPLLAEGLKGEPIDKYISDDGKLLSGDRKKIQ